MPYQEIQQFRFCDDMLVPISVGATNAARVRFLGENFDVMIIQTSMDRDRNTGYYMFTCTPSRFLRSGFNLCQKTIGSDVAA